MLSKPRILPRVVCGPFVVADEVVRAVVGDGGVAVVGDGGVAVVGDELSEKRTRKLYAKKVVKEFLMLLSFLIKNKCG